MWLCIIRGSNSATDLLGFCRGGSLGDRISNKKPPESVKTGGGSKMLYQFYNFTIQRSLKFNSLSKYPLRFCENGVNRPAADFVEVNNTRINKSSFHLPLVFLVPASSRHKFPRSACSRSIASNRDLKLPSPKPCAPCRLITSKKSVAIYKSLLMSRLEGGEVAER
jgi:hypothetical protein